MEPLHVVGWVGAYTTPYPETSFTDKYKQALFNCIKKRRYDYTYDSLCFLPYGAPLFSNGKMCVPSRQQWEEILNDVYKEVKRTCRLTPMDVITESPIDDILFENEKVKNKFFEKGDKNNV
jgi:hypothetical protein